MSGQLLSPAGLIKKEKKDLERLGVIMRRTGLDSVDHPCLCAIILQAYHDNPAWLKTKGGREVYRRAFKEIKESHWPAVIEYARKHHGDDADESA